MKFATVRNLKNQTSEMLRLAAKGTDVLITSHGKPVAVLHGLGEEDLEDYVLNRHQGLRQSIEDADREYRKKGGVPLAEVMKQLREKKKERRGKARR
jgi:prevent-host-death family protein